MSFPNWRLHLSYPGISLGSSLQRRKVLTIWGTRSLDTGITTRLSTAHESGPLRTAAALFCLQQRTRGSERRLRCLVVSGLPMVFWVGFTILTAVGPPYPWVLHLQIQPSVDWTYLKKHVLLLQTGTNRPTEHEQTFLVIIPSTISLMTIYIALPLY